MPRTDPNGRDLHPVLNYLLNRSIPETDIYRVLGIARNTYAKRAKEDDYPNAEELRLVGEEFALNTVELLVLFGLVDEDDVPDTQKYFDALAALFRPHQTQEQWDTYVEQWRPDTIAVRLLGK